MVFWWCPFPLLPGVQEQLRGEALRRWTQEPEHCPSNGVLVVPPPEDVLLAWTTSQLQDRLNQAALQSGYERILHWHQIRGLALRCDLSNTEPSHPHIEALIQNLNRLEPRILETAYRLRNEDPTKPRANLDQIAAWCQFEQEKNKLISQQHCLLEQFRQHQHSNRKMISRLISAF